MSTGVWVAIAACCILLVFMAAFAYILWSRQNQAENTDYDFMHPTPFAPDSPTAPSPARGKKKRSRRYSSDSYEVGGGYESYDTGLAGTGYSTSSNSHKSSSSLEGYSSSNDMFYPPPLVASPYGVPTDNWASPYAPRWMLHGQHPTMMPAPRPSSPGPSLIGPQRSRHQGMYTVVLDMDETLLHSNEYRGAGGIESIPVDMGTSRSNLRAHVRPYCRELLASLSTQCELVLWTAGTREYAEAILARLDPERLLSHRVFRDPAWFTYPNYVKALRWLGRDMDHTLLVDNTSSVCEDVTSSIVIEDFKGDPMDRLLPVLESIIRDLVRSGQPVPAFLQSHPDLRWSGGYIRLTH